MRRVLGMDEAALDETTPKSCDTVQCARARVCVVKAVFRYQVLPHMITGTLVPGDCRGASTGKGSGTIFSKYIM